MLAVVILSILFTWLVCAVVCIGIGGLLLRALRFSFSPLDALWTGVALIAGILQIYNFFLRVDLLAVYMLFALGLVGIVWNRSTLLSPLREIGRSRWWAGVFYVPAAVIIALRAAGPCEHYDTGLYGAQAIRWFTSYPLLPGLGNVLGQFGFNSSVFLWIAALDQGPWRGLAHHLFAGFLIAALSAWIIPAGLRVFRGGRISADDWFLTLLSVPAGIWASTGKIVGGNTDLPTTIVCLGAAYLTFRGLGEKTAGENGDGRKQMSLVIAMLLFSLAVTFKLSSLVFALVGWGLAGSRLWSLSRQIAPRKSLLALAVLLSAAIVLPWIGRGLMLTGYPFFPSTALAIPVDWKVPAVNAQAQAEFARSFARIPQIPLADTSGFRWLRPWFRDLLKEREGFLIPGFFALAGAIFVIGKRGAGLPRWLWLLLPSLAALLFWFLEAPAIRFGEPLIWTLGATLGATAAMHLLDQAAKRRIALLGLILLAGWAAHPRLVWGSHFRPSLGAHAFLRLPEARVVPHRTASGLTVYIPTDTNQCWDAPLPCSRYFNDTLHLRKAGEMSHGFASEGPAADMAP